MSGTSSISSGQAAAALVFSEIQRELSDLIGRDAMSAPGLVPSVGPELTEGYVRALRTFLSFVFDRCISRWNTLSVWNSVGEKVEHIFRLQAFQMTWDVCGGESVLGLDWELERSD